MNSVMMRDSVRCDVSKQHKILGDLDNRQEQRRMELSRCTAMINHVEEQMLALKKLYESAVQSRNERSGKVTLMADEVRKGHING